MFYLIIGLPTNVQLTDCFIHNFESNKFSILRKWGLKQSIFKTPIYSSESHFKSCYSTATQNKIQFFILLGTFP